MLNKNKNQTLKLYKGLGFKTFFSYIRFWDAPLEELEKRIPKQGIITELGCGDGILSNYIAICSNKRKVIGVDMDKKRIKVANRNVPNATFILGDIRKIKIPLSDTIVISHVLHHLSSHYEQEEVLRSCFQKLKGNGQVIILEIYVAKNVKYILGWIFDHFLVPIFFENRLYSPIYYRNKKDWEKLLSSLGFKTTIHDVSAKKPISNIMIVGKK